MMPTCEFCGQENKKRTNITIAPPRAGSLFMYRLCDNCAKKVHKAIDRIQEEEMTKRHPSGGSR